MRVNFQGNAHAPISMAGVVDMLTGDTMRTVVIAEVGLGLLSSTLAADPSVALGLFGLVAIIQVITVLTICSCSGSRHASCVLMEWPTAAGLHAMLLLLEHVRQSLVHMQGHQELIKLVSVKRLAASVHHQYTGPGAAA